MKWFLYGISLVWIAMGSWIILYTSGHRNAMKSMTRGADRKILSILPAVLGVLLLISASVSHHAWFLCPFQTSNTFSLSFQHPLVYLSLINTEPRKSAPIWCFPILTRVIQTIDTPLH